jgi:hypothetical protein
VAPGGRRLGLEQAREWAGCHPGSDVARVAGVLEEVRVDVERGRDAGMPEDAAHLGDVESEVDYPMARERVPQIVEAKRRPAVVVEPGQMRGASKAAPADIAVTVRSAARGRKDPVVASRKPARLLASCE